MAARRRGIAGGKFVVTWTSNGQEDQHRCRRRVKPSQRALIVSTILTFVGHSDLSLSRKNAIWCAALSAYRFYAGFSLLDRNLPLKSLSDKALGLVPHCLL
jgi:hypothetical protein